MYSEDYKMVKDTGSFKTGAVNFGKGMLWAFLFTVIVFAFAALLLTYTPVSEKTVPFIVVITAVISMIIAGMISSRSARSKGYLNGAITGVLYVLVLYFISAIVAGSF